MRLIQVSIFLSILFHASLMGLSMWLSSYADLWLPVPEKKELIELTVNETPPKTAAQQGPVIRKLNLPDLLKAQATRNQYDLLSDELQRVKEQLQALKSGVTQNRGKKSADPEVGESTRHRGETKQNLTTSDLANGYKVDPLTAASNSLSFEEVGESTVGVQLPDGIKAGMYTALNTDRYLYSSYYNRVEEMTLPEWSPKLDFIMKNPPNALVASIHRRFVGLVEIWSKPSGEIITIKLLKSFGIREFDESLLEAFRRARVIPNPPKDKIGPDGIVRVQMGGFITVDPKVLSRR